MPTAQEFADAFQSVVMRRSADFRETPWAGNETRWTTLMLSGEGAILHDVAHALGLELEREIWKVDGFMVSGRCSRNECGKRESYCCLATVSVTIEVENNIEWFLRDEVYKLLLHDSPLKVGITYWTRSWDDQHTLAGEMKRITPVLEARRNFWPSTPDVEYLVLVGTGDSTLQPQLDRWDAWRYTASGEATRLQGCEMPR